VNRAGVFKMFPAEQLSAFAYWELRDRPRILLLLDLGRFHYESERTSVLDDKKVLGCLGDHLGDGRALAHIAVVGLDGDGD
jgi:hypothetical protein